MTIEQLEETIKNISTLTRIGYDNWEFEIDGTKFICVSDEHYNRMRVISPITKMSNVNKEQLMKCMEANFHTVLDTKYAISNGVLWSVFIHPLKELTQKQVIDAISQVFSTAKSFGSTYTSSNLMFPSFD